MSLLFAPAELTPELLARLHLFGVLPAFYDLLKHSPAARAQLKARRFRLRIQAGRLSADLLFSQGRCRFLRDSSKPPTLCLRFLSYSQLNRQFSGKGFSLPIPTKGARNPAAFRTFAKLSESLQQALVYRAEATSPEESLHLRLTLGVALATAAELIQHERFSASLFAGETDWAAEFTIGQTDFRAWIGQTAGRTCWGRGGHPQAQARLHFKEPQVALRALDGRLDNLSAVNGGDIRIEGRLPLIDRLSLVFERVPVYLPPPKP